MATNGAAWIDAEMMNIRTKAELLHFLHDNRQVIRGY